MGSHKAFARRRRAGQGFTLVEVLIVVALLAVLGGMTFAFSVEAARHSSVKGDRDALVSALQRTRSEAMHGVCTDEGCIGGSFFGVHIDTTKAVMFEGTTYDANSPYNVPVPMHSNATALAYSADIIFAPYTGHAAAATIMVQNAAQPYSTIAIGSEGQITWDH